MYQNPWFYFKNNLFFELISIRPHKLKCITFSVILILNFLFDFALQKQEFDWDSKLQGYILSSFFYGYITTQIFGGWLSARIGGKRVFAFGIAITSVLTMITPFLAHASVYLLLAVRIIEGIFEVSILF